MGTNKPNKLTPGHNVRWESSRIILPEHRKAIVDRGFKDEQLPSPAEMKMMKEVALLEMMPAILERGRDQLQNTKMTLRGVYERVTNAIILLIKRDVAAMRRELRNANVYLKSGGDSEGVALYRYNCRGNQGEFQIDRDFARKAVSSYITLYGERLFKN